jgi:hypothetical protein
METKQLITIIVTAIIAALAKEIVSALVSLFKNLSSNKAIRERLERTFTAFRIGISLEVTALLVNIWLLLGAVREPGLPTRADVVRIGVYLIVITFWAHNLITHLAQLSLEDPTVTGIVELARRSNVLTERLDALEGRTQDQQHQLVEQAKPQPTALRTEAVEHKDSPAPPDAA